MFFLIKQKCIGKYVYTLYTCKEFAVDREASSAQRQQQ